MKKLRIVLTFLLLIMLVLYYHPLFLGGLNAEANSNILSKPIQILTVVVFALSLRTNILANQFIRLFIITFLLLNFQLLFFDVLNFYDVYSYLRSFLLIPLIAVIIGYNMNADKKMLVYFLTTYIVMTIVVGVSQVLWGVGGFSIENTFISGKNSFGCILATSFFLSVIFLFSSKNKKTLCLSLGSCLLLFVILLTVRTRTATLASVCLMLFYSYFKVKKIELSRKIKINLLALSVFFLVFVLFRYAYTGILFTDSIDNYIYASFFQNHESDFTSGRLNLVHTAVEILEESPFWGRLTLKVANYYWIHNFFFKILSDLGIFGGIIILAFYFFIPIFCLRKIILSKYITLANCGYFVILVPYFISLAEPTFPFSPGTPVFLPFMMLGIALKRDHIHKKESLEAFYNMQKAD